MQRRTLLAIAIVSGAALLILTSVLLPARDSTDGSTTTAVSFVDVEGDVSYVLGWKTSRGGDADGAFTVANDLGYEVTITEATLSTFSVTMAECEHEHGPVIGAVGLLARLGPAVAEAGHGSEDDPAFWGGPWVEDLITGPTLEVGTVTVNEPSYCEAHIAFGTTPSTEALANDEIEPTLVVRGTWSQGTDTGDFEIVSDLAWGKTFPFTDADERIVHADVGDPLEITIYRDRGVMFDGVDFRVMEEPEMAAAVLRSISNSVRFEVTGGNTH